MDTKQHSVEKDKYKIPEWTAKPPQGTHLDVFKANQLLQKLLIDEKSCYYFGRNPLACDFVVEHASCSRVHAVLLYHRILKRFAMVDLESSHGTFVENVRIQPLTPVFIDFDNSFHFGASTRRYTVRTNLGTYNENSAEDAANGRTESRSISLPTDELEVDNITEYNTAQNRRVPQIPISVEEARRKSRPRPKLRFNDEEDIINPEDVDPSVGRFRNLVRTAVIPSTAKTSKRSAATSDQASEIFEFYAPDAKKSNTTNVNRANHVNHAKSALSHQQKPASSVPFLAGSSTLGLGLTLNAAPDLDLYANIPPPTSKKQDLIGPATAVKLANARLLSGDTGVGISVPAAVLDENDPHSAANKKKYAKEAWPGRKPSSII